MKKKTKGWLAVLLAFTLLCPFAGCARVETQTVGGQPLSSGQSSVNGSSSEESSHEESSHIESSSEESSSMESSSAPPSSKIQSSAPLSSKSTSKTSSEAKQTVKSSSEFPSSSKTSSISVSSKEISSLAEISSAISSANTQSKQSSAAESSFAESSSQPSQNQSSSEPEQSSSEISSMVSSAVSSEAPPVSSEEIATPVSETSQGMKAVWLSYLEFQGFAGSSKSVFTTKIQGIFDNLTAKGLNTVIVQVRPHGDSFYESVYYPWSKCISGTMGVSVDYDPLEIMVREAHSRGLQIHAWINPYRTMTNSEFSTVDSSFLIKEWYESDNRSEYMILNKNDSRWWLKPGNKEVQKLIIDGAKEIVSNYNVDGLHLDDYFYCAKPGDYGDSVAQAKANTTAMVKGLHDGVKSIRSDIQFGISPAGGFSAASRLPASDQGYLSTDLALWCSQNGYLDYVMPQIYWEYTHSTQPFSTTFKKWQNFVTASGVKLYVGLAPYKLSTNIVETQMDDALADANGFCLFRYDHIQKLNIP